jgi:hypothetical protein
VVSDRRRDGLVWVQQGEVDGELSEDIPIVENDLRGGADLRWTHEEASAAQRSMRPDEDYGSLDVLLHPHPVALSRTLETWEWNLV